MHTSPAITTIQHAYVNKLIDTLNDLPNVVYEIANEANTGSISWQYALIDYIHIYEAGKPRQHPVWMTTPAFGNPDNVVFSSHAECVSPVLWDADFAGQKVSINDTDHILPQPQDPYWAWKTPRSR